jgi:hypothetical protein
LKVSQGNWGYFAKAEVFRENGYLFEIPRKYSTKGRFKKGSSSRKNNLYVKSLAVCRHLQDYTITRVNTKEESLLKKGEFSRAVVIFTEQGIP